MQVQILLRFAWQCVAVLLIARYRPDIPQPFRMWLYPIPALLSLALWIALFFTGPPTGVWFSLGFLGLGLVALPGLPEKAGPGGVIRRNPLTLRGVAVPARYRRTSLSSR